MNISSIESILENSDSQEWTNNSTLTHFTYKKDVCLRIERTRDAIPVNSAWIKDFPNSKSYGIIYTVYYNQSVISELEYISIDDRVVIPLHAYLIFEKKDYNITKILNNGNSLVNGYLNFLKIKL